MNESGAYDYGWWMLVAINSAIILIFSCSFYHPKTTRNWHSFGAFSAFIIAWIQSLWNDEIYLE